jgi:FAD/FMN-containing dehydrogenase
VGGAALGTLLQIKQALDPANVMNPGKLGFPVDGR